ncbi:MAG: protoglobin domain-containing protein [Thermodesulfovibrionales bacterium]
MRAFKQIKQDYRFTEDHERWLKELRPLMEEHADEVMNTLNSWMLGHKDTARFFDEDRRRNHIFSSQRQWFINLFSGGYDQRFYERLMKISMVHVKFKVEPHYMSRAVNVMRNTCIGIISRTDEPKEIMTNWIIALGKILDISLDVINTAYHEEEIKTYSPVYKVKSMLIEFAEKFSQTMNLVLILALIGLTIGVVWLFGQDIRGLVSGSVHIGEGIISALGSLLMLWVVIELMNTEIVHLKGGKFHISVFIGVALVTTIRETMIATLRHEAPSTIYYLIASVLVIGFVYWLVTKTEEKR